MNFNNKKTQKIISTVIIVILVASMVIPMVASYLM